MARRTRDSRPEPLDATPAPARARPEEEPPSTAAERETAWVSDHTSDTRDMTPALGVPGQPAGWERAQEDATVSLHRSRWADAAWSFLFKADTSYAGTAPQDGQVADANRRMRGGPPPEAVHGPFIKAPVWTWEVPLYFWFGGIAAGSSFVALACDLAGDHRSAATARKVALAAVLPSPPLLIADLGRPGRFLNMLRIFKPRSPMNTGAWSLVAFSTLAAGAVGADVARRPRLARRVGAANAVVGGYLGSYTGILLAATAVPVWARSRLFLGPIFVSTAAATGAAASRLVLIAEGLPAGHPTRNALGTIETGAMLTELGLSVLNERRLGRAGRALHGGRAGRLFRAAELAVGTGLALRLVRRRLGRRAHDAASVLYLGGGLAFRYAWMEAGRASARDDEAVAQMARGSVTVDDRLRPRQRARRLPSSARSPRRGLLPAQRLYTETLRRLSLAAERVLGA